MIILIVSTLPPVETVGELQQPIPKGWDLSQSNLS
jgi:hypothetical protein